VTREELLEEAERNSDGSLRSIEFAWIKKGNKMNKGWEIFGKTPWGSPKSGHRGLAENRP
jgi:hypothetical protein